MLFPGCTYSILLSSNLQVDHLIRNDRLCPGEKKDERLNDFAKTRLQDENTDGAASSMTTTTKVRVLKLSSGTVTFDPKPKPIRWNGVCLVSGL